MRRGDSYAEVAIPLGVTGTFTYKVPQELGAVAPGMRVIVPWGTKLTTAFVVATDVVPSVEASRIKPIREVLDDEPSITSDVLELCIWASDYYIAPLGEMLRIALPANLSVRGKTRFRVTSDTEELGRFRAGSRLSAIELDAFEVVLANAGALLPERFARDFPALTKRLRAAGVIADEEALRDRAGVRFDRYVILDSPPPLLPEKQQAVVDALGAVGGSAPYSALLAQELSGSAINTLIKKGVLKVERRRRSASLDPFRMRGSDFTVKFTSEQQRAVEAIAEQSGAFAPFLLQGVTGSGKTEVYIELMQRTVREGRQAILLVPEIALTPVFAARLTAKFGERVAILHSNLSVGEKYDQWRKARDGEVDVAIGPRSALFTPFERLGLIVVDEEGDAAYKQEETPRYNARDLAVVRARIRGIPVILGSATPSLETRANAENGKYTLLTMERRVEERGLPAVEVIDLRRERGEKEDRGMVIFSAPLVEELKRVFAAGEQAIILMNRRGYAPFLLCRECENDFRCRDCSVTLTVHRRDGLLVCHYCGYRRPIPQRCPVCNGEVLQPIGFGTEKVEERFRRMFPEVSVAVLDRDSTRRKGELVRILEEFRAQKTQVLIGTQIISKGHHFPNVTLTAVINADAILGYPDFRSAEKTFYLLTQVAGRSGRGELPGKVLIQSAFPTHYAIQHAARHDYEGFFRSEVEFRERFHYPPFTGMIAITLRGEDAAAVERAADEAGKRVDDAVRELADVRMQGPAPAPLSRIKGVYRFQMLVRSKQRTALRRAVERALVGKSFRGAELVIDVDPLNIL